jgi:flagellar biosynthesis protein FlhA
MIACLLVMLVPLPAVLMDALLVINITVAIVVLLTALFVQSPTEFNVFPTLLLATTLTRLVLNVATTRLILARGQVDGIDAAGSVVRSFGQFVAGDQIVIGAVIFAIIVLIQFLVITKGASRIGEVAARFTLDGLPGKQLAIDADLTAGVIDHIEAKRRRDELSLQADFYGAMDGASKFVRGDAVAGVMITLVNILGGMVVGVLQSGMSLTEAMDIYTKLTIGDGLVSQVPAFLISLAAGLLITRSSAKTNLPEEFIDQLLVRPEVLGVTAVFLVVLCFTRLPMVPLLMSAAVCGTLAWKLGGRPSVPKEKEAVPQKPQVQPKPEKRVEEFLHVEPLELEIGVGLLRLADPRRGGDLLERISSLRQRVAADLGIVLPKVRIRDNLRLDDHDYRIKISNTPVAMGTCLTNRLLACDSGALTGRIEGVACRMAALGTRSVWVDLATASEAEAVGYRLLEPADVLLEHLRMVVHQNADELLGRDATQHLLDELAQTQPTVVRELVPNLLRLGTVQQVLQQLLREGLSVRQLGLILEILCDHAPDTQDAHELTRCVRQRVGRSLSLALRDNSNTLWAIAMDVDLQNALLGARHRSRSESAIRSQFAGLAGACYEAAAELRRYNRPEVLIVPDELCRFVRPILAERLPYASVLGQNEVAADTQLEIVREVSLPQEMEYAA